MARVGAAGVLASLCLALLAARPAAAQSDSVTVVPGAHYRPAGDLHTLVLGTHYRPLWTTPIRVPVLDLAAFAGGLTPVEEGGHKQTRSLRFRGADGREYNFRSVDKDVGQGLPEYARETLVDRVLQDLTSAQLPVAALVATALLDAVGVLNPGPRLYVLPDDPALGEFRAAYAGMLGTLEVHADEGENERPLFAGSPRVVGTDRLLEHLEESPRNRVDARAFLRARLVDALIGDFDRHADQWRWARYDRDGLHWWVPVPEDRDYAFVHYDGLLPAFARRTVAPRLIRFEDRFPAPLALTSNSLELNRRLLAELSWLEWSATAARLREALSDAVIEDAVRRMPPEHVRLYGETLARRLRARRDRLPEFAASFYRTLAQSVEIHATDEAERAEVSREADGAVLVRLAAADAPGDSAYFSRRFHPGETGEVRVFLHGGDDRAAVSGGDAPIVVRLLGGGGDDVLEDRSRGPTALYDSRGDNRFVEGPRTRVSRRDPPEPEEDDGLLPSVRRDWGESRSLFAPYADWRSHAELVVGGGPSWTRYGFRHHPYRWRADVRALLAPLHGRFGVEATGDLRRESSPVSLRLRGSASRLEATSLHGFGNDSRPLPSREARVWHDRFLLSGGVHAPVAPGAEASLSALVRRTASSPPPGAAWTEGDAYGADAVGQVGAAAEVRWETPGEPFGSGARLDLAGALFPALWDVRSAYGRVRAEGSAGREIPGAGGAVAAARAGGTLVMGEHPFFDAAFLGGWDSLRGYRHQRLAGDAAAFGGVELHLPVAPAELGVRGELGATLFADAGRVFVGGESPGGWHRAVGASLWFRSPLGAVMLGLARGEETRFYLRLDRGG